MERSIVGGHGACGITRRSWLVMLLLAAPAVALQDVPLQVGSESLTDGRPNILLIIADDVGVDRVAAYAEHPDPGRTPVIDGLAAEGVLFRNAWSNPGCSPTRATILTGRYSFRTEIGRAITYTTSTDHELDPGWPSVARSLAGKPHASAGPLGEAQGAQPPMTLLQSTGYETLAVGKWHLSIERNSGMQHPSLMGFDHHRGTMDNLPSALGELAFFDYDKAIDGRAAHSTVYATSDQVDDAIELIAAASQPWFMWLAFNAPHGPYHAPPEDLHGCDLPPRVWMDIPLHHQAMTEAMDTEIGRLLEGIPAAQLAETYIIFVGDNGTPGVATTLPFIEDHAKGSPYEGGVNVPLIVAGPGVPAGAECAALVNTTDLYATICELAGVVADPGPDAVSMAPYLDDPELPSLRDWVYAESFAPNGPGPYVKTTRTMREDRYKLILRTNVATGPGVKRQFYDLWADPFELNELTRLGPLSPEEQIAFDELAAEMAQLTP